MSPNTGDIIVSRYKIVRKLGEGGFGKVFLAKDIHLDNKKVALKMCSAPPTDPIKYRRALRQFKKEASILANLRHPNLPLVTDLFVDEKTPFFVMDYIQGEDLAERLNRYPTGLPETETNRIINQILDALIYLHSQHPPVIHRDIKPANIRIQPDNVAFLVDFGISKTGDTMTGAEAHSFNFSPPEQYGDRTDERADIYALGATLYTLLTGSKPADSLDRMQNMPLVAPRGINPAISERIEKVILKAMELDRSSRYQTAMEFKSDLLSKDSPIQPDLAPSYQFPIEQISSSIPISSEDELFRDAVVVAADGSGQFRTINEGIKAAKKGGVVKILPGIYQENCIIKKNIKLIGADKMGNVILIPKTQEPGIRIINGLCVVALMTIHAPSQKQAVQVNGGKAFILYCDIYGGQESAMLINDAEIHMQGCWIHLSEGDGLVCGGEANGEIKGTLFFGNKGSGVCIQHQSVVLLSECTFSENDIGVETIDTAKPTMFKCSMEFNTRNGFTSRDNSTPSLFLCSMTSNENGLVTCDKSYPILKDCAIKDNKDVGVATFDESHPTLIECEVKGNWYVNFHFYDNSSPTLDSCAWDSDVTYDGDFTVEDSANPKLIGCGEDSPPFFNKE